MDFSKIIKISSKGALLAILFMVLSFASLYFLPEFLINFRIIYGLWVLSFLFIGAYSAKMLKGSQHLLILVLITNFLTTALTIVGVILTLMVNQYIRSGSTFDSLGVLGIVIPILLFGPPVLFASICAGSIGGLYYYKK